MGRESDGTAAAFGIGVEDLLLLLESEEMLAASLFCFAIPAPLEGTKNGWHGWIPCDERMSGDPSHFEFRQAVSELRLICFGLASFRFGGRYLENRREIGRFEWSDTTEGTKRRVASNLTCYLMGFRFVDFFPTEAMQRSVEFWKVCVQW